MFCPNCGAEVEENSRFCPNCGANLASFSENDDMNRDNDQSQGQFSGQFSGQQGPTGFDYNNYQQSNPMGGSPFYLNLNGIQKRDIIIAIILSIVTCGFYAIYWFIVLTDETNQITNRTAQTSGVMAFLLSLITCGIYYFYWTYKLGEKVDIMKGNPNGNTSILFLILSIFGLGIVNYIIAQDTINNLVGQA